MLQVAVRARRLLSAHGKCKFADDNSASFEVDHAPHDDTSEPVFESGGDDDPSTSGAGIHHLQYGDANAELTHRTPTGGGFGQFRGLRRLWTAGILIRADCGRCGSADGPVAVARCYLSTWTEKDRVLVRRVFNRAKIRKFQMTLA